MDDLVAQFTAVTSADPEKAAQYLRLTEGNLEQAIQLFYDSPALDLNTSENSHQTRLHASEGRDADQPPYREDREGVVHIDSDDEAPETMDIDGESLPSRSHRHNPSSSFTRRPAIESTYEDDEAIAKRLQNEMYETGENLDEVRAPVARVSETLVGPGSDWGTEEDDYGHYEILARQRRARQGRLGIFNQRANVGTVWDDEDSRRQNLRDATAGASETSAKSNHLAELYRPPFEIISPLSWLDARDEGKEEKKWILVNIQDSAIFDCQVLNRDVWKNEQIKETVRENFIFMQHSKDDPRASEYIQYYFQAHESQDAYPHIAIVDPRTGEQVKVWSGPPVPKAMDFVMQLHEFLDRYSLQADARNPVAMRKAEHKKELNVNKLSEEEMLEMAMKNSLANNSGTGPRDMDPDELTRLGKRSSAKDKGKASIGSEDLGAGPETRNVNGAYSPSTNSTYHNSNNTATYTSPSSSTSITSNPKHDSNPDTKLPKTSTTTTTTTTTVTATKKSPFSQISSTSPHQEPRSPYDSKTMTRIQFRYSGGRQIRIFLLSDPVRRLYEWLKSSSLLAETRPSKTESSSGNNDDDNDNNNHNNDSNVNNSEAIEFELIFLGQNLIEALDVSIEEAGLKNGTVMVEVLDD